MLKAFKVHYEQIIMLIPPGSLISHWFGENAFRISERTEGLGLSLLFSPQPGCCDDQETDDEK